MSGYTWDDVCVVRDCTHDNPECGAWAELRDDREHEHTPGQIKWNGGNPVFLCAVCRVIGWYAYQDPAGTGRWLVGLRYGT